ncbi:MAG: tetratricopeptide repeat protein, partial [Comamonas sp.]
MDLIHVAEHLTSDHRDASAAQLYREWIRHHSSPALYVAHFNLGVIQAKLQDHEGAEQSYRAALELMPGFVQAHLNLGNVLERRGLSAEALTEWRMALALTRPDAPDDKPLRIHALNNLGRLLEICKDYTAAEDMLTQSLALDPKQPEAIAHWVHLRQKLCLWPAFKPFEGATHADLVNGASALALLAGSDDPAVQLAAARRYVQKKVLSLQEPLAAPEGYHHPRLRIGYLSSDFCNHAVSILTAELYALHDRAKVEVYGFCWSREDGSPLRARVVGAMDHYIRIDGMSDEAAARCIREHEIDILVDLHGLTLGARHDILSWRPAPVQVTYLGFPGTTALPAIDYVIADRFVFPEELAPCFTEKPLYLPGCFQINDRQRAIGPRPTRAACGLPDDAFVFCSFNSTFKITPEMFGAWMEILRHTANSVLWLIADSDAVRDTLRQEARQHDVDPERLIFAQRVAPENYLARYQVADLFLDTNPFNAGTTASDALWAGLPLLTYAGATFGSRMAGSLLHAVDLPELVTHS